MAANDRAPGLRRDLGLWSAAAIVVGTVIGSGIFLVPKDMAAAVGSPAMVLLVWVAGGALSLAGALTYAELSAALPEAGGEYVYLRAAYGPFWGFLFAWTQMWVGKSGSVATLATAFFLYLANFRPALEGVAFRIGLPIGPEGGPLEVRYGQFLAMGVILLLAGVNYFGVRFGGGVQVAVTLVKVTLIAAIIVLGFSSGAGSAANYATATAAPGGAGGFFLALVAALWAYDGWNNVSMVSSEIREPQRNLPRALIVGTLVVVAIYLMTNLAYFYVLPAARRNTPDSSSGRSPPPPGSPRSAPAAGCAAARGSPRKPCSRYSTRRRPTAPPPVPRKSRPRRPGPPWLLHSWPPNLPRN